MAEAEELTNLRELYQDLLSLGESRLRNIDRLWTDLEAHVDEFRQLLDKPSRNDASRAKLKSGAITVAEEQYSINSEFQENATQLADTLDLDELESAKVLLESQEDATILERSIVTSAIIRFHERRHFLLECIRLLIKQVVDPDGEEGVRDISSQLLTLILETKDSSARNGSSYTQRCLGAMADIEKWLQALGERQQGVQALGQTLTPELSEVLVFQQSSLAQQHESLGALLCHLIKANVTSIEDFHKLLEHLPRLERWSNLVVHYVPIIIEFTSQYGSPDGSAVLSDARSLNKKILDTRDSTLWMLRDLQAATITWWLAEYAGFYLDQPTSSPLQNVNLEAEAETRAEAFVQALQDGAFQCMVSICSQVTQNDWYNPVKNSLIQYLLRNSQPLPQDLALTSSYFHQLLMEQFEAFADAFITNMPDTLRRFKTEEDEQRKLIRSGLQKGSSGDISEQVFHLERFLVIISFAFDKRSSAALVFWNDVDSNLYGFLQWASRRQSTPGVGAFCEMLRAISEGEECAAAAHRFLLEESVSTSTKMRRSTSLSWAQIFDELTFYTSKIREQPMALRPISQYSAKHDFDEIAEPESPYMLENYLRLTFHLCNESTEVRSWILSQSNFPILDVLLQLCVGEVSTRLQACAFMVIRALLTDKSTDLGATVWVSLDQWVFGRYLPSSNVPRQTSVMHTPARTEQITFDAIASNFEQANEFIDLLQSLVLPATQNIGLHDQLPFPENLGSAYRMSGIEPYIDFVFDKVFASKSIYLEEPLQGRILTENILGFAAVCLSTFNEDLVVLANRSTVPVDEAMNTSSLLAYVRLHPFARVMEWLFNERVVAALFTSAHQDIEDISGASPDSPQMLSLLRSIDVMNLVMDLQSTYLDIVRPLIKLQSASRTKPVLNASLASFEDSVALNLGLVVDLGLYAGLGNQDLTVASLNLLAKFASSRKLNAHSTQGLSQRLRGNRLISIVEQHDDLDPIARSLTFAMSLGERELAQANDAPGWTIISIILDFLIHCLSSSPEQPTLAHALLGFSCQGISVDVDADGLFAKNLSLFHAVLHLVTEYPDGGAGSMQAWALILRQKGMQILSILWASSLTSIFTLSELRANGFLFSLFLRQSPVMPDTIWNGHLIRDPAFMYTESAEALEQFLWLRCAILTYASTEVRLVGVEGVPSLKARIFSTLLGSTTLPDGAQAPNPTIFDLLDFLELDIIAGVNPPTLKYFAGLDFEISADTSVQEPTAVFNMKLVDEMISLRMNELRRAGRFQGPNEEEQAGEESRQILLYFRSENRRVSLTSARRQTLKAWADLLTLAIGTCDLDLGGKAALILQALQLLTPKLEAFSSTNIDEALDVANLVLALLFQLDFQSPALDSTRAGDVANDRLFSVFRTALRAVNSPIMEMPLREILYQVCYRYLSGMSQTSDAPLRRRHGTQMVKSTGERTIDVICDDAYGASSTCRISAFLLLDSLAGLANEERSNYITDNFLRTNFIQILVESIESIPQELRGTPAKEIPLLLSYYEAKLSLLLTISQTRQGATHLLNNSLFSSVRASGLFAVDPDIGIEIDNPTSLQKYYALLLSLTRLITSTTLTIQSHPTTIDATRTFLAENRALVVSLFKRRAGIGGVSFDDVGAKHGEKRGGGDVVGELVDLFTVLVGVTGFLDYEDERDFAKDRRKGLFT